MAADSGNLYQKLYTPLHPDLGTGPVSVEPYISPEYFEREQRKIFDNAWMLACAESEIPQPGSYLVKEVPLVNSSVIFARGADGVVRAFRNVCRHRGNKLFYNECRGKARGFTCKFHGWHFALDGKLRGVTEADRFFDLDKPGLGLTPVLVDTWNGLVFVNRGVGTVQPLREYLGSLVDGLEQYPFRQMGLAAEWKVDVKANWKVMIDAFQEGYHVGLVHRNTVQGLFTGPKRPTCRLSHFRLHGPHRAVTTPKNPDFKPSVTEALAFQLAGAGLSQEAGELHGSSGLQWSGLNPGGEPDFGFDINIVFPATFIDTSFGWFFTYEFWPQAVDRTYWVAKLFVVPPKTWAQRIGLEMTIIQLREALYEDLTTLEATQKGLSSGAMDTIMLSDQELALRHQHAIVEKMVRGA